jgi:hypothetical protein
MFMWSKTVKEAHVFEVNFRQSLQMMVDGSALKAENNYDSFTDAKAGLRDDGVPSLERSVSGGPRVIPTSKFLLNEEEEDDRLSNITEIVCERDEDRFRTLYNQQGHYSAT